MEKRLSSSGIFRRTYFIGDPPEDPKDLKDRNIEPENFEDQITFMSMFSDMDWTKRGNAERCVSNSEQVNKTRAEILARTLDILRSAQMISFLESKRSGMELSATHLKENGIQSPHRWWDDSKKLVTQYSRASVL